MGRVKLYLCDPSVYTTLIDEVLYKFHFFRNKDEVIVICNVCYYYFTSLFVFTSLCFRELRKCLCENFLLKGQKIEFPPNVFEQLTFRSR